MYYLEDNGFQVIGSIRLPAPTTFEINLGPSFSNWGPAIYAFRIGGKVVRIGQTTQTLKICLLQRWQKDVSRALKGDFRPGGTNPYEAFQYRLILQQHGSGEVLARQEKNDGELTKRERWLIKECDPYLCNDSPEGRKRPPLGRGVGRRVGDVAAAEAYWRSLNSASPPEMP